jgi:hypothetical protein
MPQMNAEWHIYSSQCSYWIEQRAGFVGNFLIVEDVLKILNVLNELLYGQIPTD